LKSVPNTEAFEDAKDIIGIDWVWIGLYFGNTDDPFATASWHANPVS
jgi:hypothetical protein